jgi:hypothetical protein
LLLSPLRLALLLLVLLVLLLLLLLGVCLPRNPRLSLQLHSVLLISRSNLGRHTTSPARVMW